MGCVNTVKEKLKLQCCGKFSEDWQSHSLNFKLKSGKVVSCYEGGAQNVSISDIYLGEIDDFCNTCEKSTTYYIKNGKIKGSDVHYYDNGKSHIEKQKGLKFREIQ